MSERPSPDDTYLSDTERIRNTIIDTFLQVPEDYVSGTSLSQAAGVSRTAVWKHIGALEDIGFEFESVHGRGYRLRRAPDLLLQPLLAPYLQESRCFGKTVLWYREIDSTNLRASELAPTLPHGALVSAWSQKGGRGRRGRPWFSPKAGLWMSIVLKRPFPLNRAAELTLMTSVALRRAIINQTGLPVLVKWPNDLLLNGKKISGILAEIRAEGEFVGQAVLGIGINANTPKDEFPEPLRAIATSLFAESGVKVDRLRLTGELFSQLEPMYNALAENKPAFDLVREEWLENCSTIGKLVRVQTPIDIVEGVAERIDEAGVLFIRTSVGALVPIHSGDVLFDPPV